MKTLTLLLAMVTSALGAEIIAPETSSLGVPIVVTAEVALPEDCRVAYLWEVFEGVSLIAIGNGQQAYIWAAPGDHKLNVVVAVVTAEIDIQTATTTFLVTGGSPLPEQTLRELVTNDQAALLAEFYYEWSKAVESVSTTQGFFAAYGESILGMEAGGGMEAAFLLIDLRIEALIGGEDRPLKGALKGSLVAELSAVSDEFGGFDPRPPAINAPGLNVMMFEESGDRSTLPLDQLMVITNSSRDVRGAGGGFRLYDPTHDDLGNDMAHWREAAARTREGMPWVIISSDRGSYEGPLPATLAEWRELLAQYEGEE